MWVISVVRSRQSVSLSLSNFLMNVCGQGEKNFDLRSSTALSELNAPVTSRDQSQGQSHVTFSFPFFSFLYIKYEDLEMEGSKGT